MPEVDRKRLYSLAEAAALIPSCQAGKTVHPVSLRKWVRQGRLASVSMPGRRGIFIPGSEIARFLSLDDWPRYEGRTRAETEKAAKQCLADLRRMGLKV